jgi:uncharacterized protein YeaC (DUF1315 family)
MSKDFFPQRLHLARLMNNEQAIKALMAIEGFHNLNQDMETIINKSGIVKKAKQESNDKELSAKDKRELADSYGMSHLRRP